MPMSWLKNLGGKLLEAGAAYLDQVRFVQELRAMPPEQAREQFLSHVRNLSTSARAGLALTLSTLVNQERQGEARRFLETLRAAITDPDSWKADTQAHHSQVVATQPAVSASEVVPSPEGVNTLESDLHRMEAWAGLEAPTREQALAQHLAVLNEVQLKAFQASLQHAEEKLAALVQEHHANEARLAAGRYIEDQHAYRLARLAGAPPDQDWLASLRQYELLQEVVQQAQAHLAQRQAQSANQGGDRASSPEAATAAPLEASSPQLTPQALQHMLREEIASGRIGPDRAVAYERMLQKATEIVDAPDMPAAARATRMQDLFTEFMPHVANPSLAAQQATTPRGRELLRHAGEIKTAVLRETMASAATQAAETAQVLSTLVADLTRVQQEAATAHDTATLAGLEAHLLRPAARRWHEHHMTRHAMLAWPHWQTNPVPMSVNRLLYAGSAELLPLMETVAHARLLEVEGSRRLQNTGQARWDALNACHVAVFDLRRAGELPELALRAPKRARELTGSAYELGLALALGRPVVVLASPGDNLPFDIDLSPLLLDGTDDDADALAQALDDAFYLPQRPTRENALPQALAELDRLTQGHPMRAQFEGMQWLNPSLAQDPAGFSTAVHQVLRALQDPRAQLLRPSWPGAVPGPSQPRCFHVMPYRPTWAQEVAAAAEEAVGQQGMVYRLGKQGEDGCIVRGIWDDLCRASVVLVELAGGNLNVMIELGMAHALGRRVLAVQHSGEADLRPPHIEKLRVHHYDSPAALQAILRERLAVAGDL